MNQNFEIERLKMLLTASQEDLSYQRQQSADRERQYAERERVQRERFDREREMYAERIKDLERENRGGASGSSRRG